MRQEILAQLDERNRLARSRRQVISYLVAHGPSTISEIAKGIDFSVPTVTKFLEELKRQQIVQDYGKLETAGGRFPTLYGFKPEAGHFVGVDVKHDHVHVGIVDFVGKEEAMFYDIPYQLVNTEEKLEELCEIIQDRIYQAGMSVEEILNININIPGRVNPTTGGSYTIFNFNANRTLGEVLKERLGCHVTLDNDSRSMAYGEYTRGQITPKDKEKYKNILYLNLGWGVGLGIFINGKIYLGRSGFSGEVGHIATFENQILCSCGKKGCLETEVGGRALCEITTERIQAGETSILSPKVQAGEELGLDDILRAIGQEDPLCMDILSEMGVKLGRSLAGLINIFNPDLVIIGGRLSETGDYLTHSIQSSVRTYSLNLVNRDTKIITATLGDKAGIAGACMLSLLRRFEERD